MHLCCRSVSRRTRGSVTAADSNRSSTSKLNRHCPLRGSQSRPGGRSSAASRRNSPGRSGCDSQASKSYNHARVLVATTKRAGWLTTTGAEMTSVTIFGSGNMGTAIAGVLTTGGAAVEHVGSADSDATIGGDIVILAVPYPALRDIVAKYAP